MNVQQTNNIPRDIHNERIKAEYTLSYISENGV